MRRPVLAFTIGDPAGVGPALVVAALRCPDVRRACEPVAVGSRRVLERAGWTPGLAPILDLGAHRFPLRRPSMEGGRLSYAAVEAAVRLCARGLAEGIVTAPVSKEAWRMAGAPYLDHTELLKERTGSKAVAMMLVAGPLRAVLATRHVPLAKVARLLNAERIREAAVLAERALRKVLGIRRPRLALCAFNPHGGEGGLLGQEEKETLEPAASSLRRGGLSLSGPLPADAAWAAHRAGRYDALVALYHDQALIPLKLAAGYAVVNWTLGLPFVRASPGHGTAYDIAWRGKADPSGMIAAALWAVQAALGPVAGTARGQA